jgi:hypothetical protein
MNDCFAAARNDGANELLNSFNSAGVSATFLGLRAVLIGVMLLCPS